MAGNGRGYEQRRISGMRQHPTLRNTGREVVLAPLKAPPLLMSRC